MDISVDISYPVDKSVDNFSIVDIFSDRKVSIQSRIGDILFE